MTPEEKREKIREKDRKYREANREKILELKRKYHETHREKENERSRKYREANLEKIREKDRKYRERVLSTRPKDIKYRERALELKKAYRVRLVDSYIATMLGMQVAKIPSHLLQAKREQIMTYRCMKQLLSTLKEKETE